MIDVEVTFAQTYAGAIDQLQAKQFMSEALQLLPAFNQLGQRAEQFVQDEYIREAGCWLYGHGLDPTWMGKAATLADVQSLSTTLNRIVSASEYIKADAPVFSENDSAARLKVKRWSPSGSCTTTTMII